MTIDQIYNLAPTAPFFPMMVRGARGDMPFAAYFGIVNPPPGLFVMMVLVVPLAAFVAVVSARFFAGQAGTDATEGGA